MRSAEELPGSGQIPGGDAATDLRASDLLPVGKERRDELDRETLPLAQRSERLRGAAALEPESGIWGHDEAGQVDPLADGRHERFVWGDSKSVVEMLHDRDLDAGGLQADEALVRIAQQRRREALDQLLRMGVERDDRGSRAGVPGSPTQLAEKIQVTAVEAVEDTDRHVESTEIGSREH